MADLQALIRGAGLRVPVVLVDPPEQNLAAFMPAGWKAEDIAATAKRDQFLERCEQAALADASASPKSDLQGCLRPPPSWMRERVSATVAAYKHQPAYWRTLRSELAENAAIFDAAVSPDEAHGTTPIVVLAASDTYANVPEEMRTNMEAARKAAHDAIAASSRQGRVQPVAESSHDMPIDQPQAIADAVGTLLPGMTTPARE